MEDGEYIETVARLLRESELVSAWASPTTESTRTEQLGITVSRCESLYGRFPCAAGQEIRIRALMFTWNVEAKAIFGSTASFSHGEKASRKRISNR